MPLPQVNERIKEVPAQALRAVFAGIGQVLLVADKIRNRAVEQVTGTAAATAPPRDAPATEPAAEPTPRAGEPTGPAEPTKPAGQAGAAGPTKAAGQAGPAAQAKAARQAEAAGQTKPAGQARAAKQTKAAGQAGPAAQAKAAGQAEAAGQTKPAKQARAAGRPEEAKPTGGRWRSLDETGNVRLISEGDGTAAATASAPAPSGSAAPAAPVPGLAEPGGLPLSNYDELTVASLRARLRVLSVSQITILLDYEKGTQARPAVITMFERRLAKLAQEDLAQDGG